MTSWVLCPKCITILLILSCAVNPFQLFATLNDSKINNSLYMSEYFLRSQILRTAGSDCTVLDMQLPLLGIMLNLNFSVEKF